MSNVTKQDPTGHTIHADAPLVNFRAETIGQTLGPVVAEWMYSWQKIPPGASAVLVHRLAMKLDAWGTIEVSDEDYKLILASVNDAPLVPWCKVECLYLLGDPALEDEDRAILAARHEKATLATLQAQEPSQANGGLVQAGG